VRCSIAITDDADIAVDSTTTILSSLLLSSELKGYIENPAWYLQDNIQSVTALDYLMMTHGWRRYNVPEVVKGNLDYSKIPFQASQQITGKVNGGFRSRPVSNSEVLIVTKDGDYGITMTDEKGSFMFQNFEYPDSASFMIRALNSRGNSNVELVMNEETFPRPVRAPFVETDYSPFMYQTDNNPSLRENAFIVKAEQRARYDEDMWLIHLGEVEVTAQRIERRNEVRQQFWANASSDATVRREEIERTHRTNVADYLVSVPGVHVSVEPNDRLKRIVKIAGTEAPALILVDGMPGDINELSDSEVESIDVLKFASATTFGTRGMGGVISITTRRGGKVRDVEKFNQTVYTPLGYQKPVEFYSPKYETLESKHLTIPDYRTTIFWKPDLVISDDNEEATFEFYTSDFTTTYSVVIEGLTTDGQIVRQVEKIRVE